MKHEHTMCFIRYHYTYTILTILEEYWISRLVGNISFEISDS